MNRDPLRRIFVAVEGEGEVDAVPYLLLDSEQRGPGGSYTESGVAGCPPVVAHQLMEKLLLR